MMGFWGLVNGGIGPIVPVKGLVMMADVDFSNVPSTNAWFERQNVQVRCTIAGRAALRVLANICADQTMDSESLALACLRANITALGRGNAQTTDVDWRSVVHAAGEFALEAADFAASAFRSGDAASSARSAARCAAFASDYADFSARSVQLAADSANIADFAAFPPLRSGKGRPFTANLTSDSAAKSDADSLAETPHLFPFPQKPVWGNIEVPAAIAINHQSFLGFLASDPKWEFWHDWYLAMWDGTFTDWDLALEVIKIEDAVRKAGADAVALEIEIRRAKLDVKNAAQSVEKYLKKTPLGFSEGASPMMGHNNPPPDFEEVPVSYAEMQRLVQIVQIVQTQLQTTTPNAQVLETVTKEAEAIQEKSVGWLAKGLGLSRDEFFKTFGKWVALAAVAKLSGAAQWLAGAMEQLYPLIQALWTLLRLLAT
ncbi:hypothetical protein [Pseudosulfitobacter sp. SM2401]|uniref:hypothetical protein n=1 Tax=Pseudosulfitobacter sp. SM2401 TaxID=3350098 RepID=UPI0036F335CF